MFAWPRGVCWLLSQIDQELNHHDRRCDSSKHRTLDPDQVGDLRPRSLCLPDDYQFCDVLNLRIHRLDSERLCKVHRRLIGHYITSAFQLLGAGWLVRGIDHKAEVCGNAQKCFSSKVC